MQKDVQLKLRVAKVETDDANAMLQRERMESNARLMEEEGLRKALEQEMQAARETLAAMAEETSREKRQMEHVRAHALNPSEAPRTPHPAILLAQP